MTDAVTLDEFRETFSAIPAPVAIVTAAYGGDPFGTTVSSFCALSADPPLVLVALDRESNTLRVVRETQRFGLNVLAAGQDEVARTCATKELGKFGAVDWHEDRGLPRIEGAASWLACEVMDELPGGDHVIVTGLVTACDASDRAPLVYHRRAFATPIGSRA